MEDVKLLGRSDKDSENKIKIKKTISKGINMNFYQKSVPKFILNNTGNVHIM